MQCTNIILDPFIIRWYNFKAMTVKENCILTVKVIVVEQMFSLLLDCSCKSGIALTSK